MNTIKTVAIATIVALAAVAVLGVGLALAQGATPWSMLRDGMMTGYQWQDGTPAPGYGPGMMGHGGRMGASMMNGDVASMQAMHDWMATTGGMHTVVWNSLAEALGLTPEALQAEIAAGQTLAEVAEAQGVDEAQLVISLDMAMQAGLDQAVAQGALTQDQADEMLSHMAGRYAWMIEHMGSGPMGTGMMDGTGRGGCHRDAAVTPDTDG